MKPIPALEDVSAEYARLSGLHNDLMARSTANDTHVRELHAAIGAEQPGNSHADRVASLLAGVDHQAPPPIKDQLVELAKEKRAIDDALKELYGQLFVERKAASSLIVKRFSAEHAAMAAEFFKHIAAAARAHAEYGELRRAFHRAGVDPAGLHDFGQELFGDPGHRNGEVGIAMRVAARSGYLKTGEIPEAYK